MAIKSLELEHMTMTRFGWQCPNCFVIKMDEIGAIWQEQDIDSEKCTPKESCAASEEEKKS